MKIVIIENELYLAQSIAAKLSEFHFDTEIYSSVKEAMEARADVYLLSTNLPGQNFMPLIEKFRDKNVLLMVNYINNDTVGEPLKAGARDYIVKPFTIEELLRKIEHFHDYRMLQERNRFYQEYLDHLYREVECNVEAESLTLPLVIRTNYQRAADKLALRLNRIKKNILTLISLDEAGWKEKVAALDNEHIGYIIHLEKLKKNERQQLFELLEGKLFLLTDSSGEVETPYPTLTLTADNKLYDQDEILTIDEYVQYIVKTFQYKFPDTELSKKLGISRKSLWEKRKKYDLFKKK
ncbi:response regulator [Nitratifractor salsuginis]|uniref:Two component transcriptional regulator, Fis family n=1 Tax=Nitratifractor salsuginis (strain DSM 16511 / JCM 12458 / E9I37-1) TaxID=749222 RepID=E6X0Y2_NITSE|nr:response regulator [Nitratifractor salsuginis]ADV46914.1 two component transcriptional regulator, Fis family [Nitratifractor salsuginis DSM 16511]